MTTPTPEQFRAAGMTAEAVNYPRPPDALAALRRLNGLPDHVPHPPAWAYFPNAWCRDNWRYLYAPFLEDDV
jgi:hypothetical protein